MPLLHRRSLLLLLVAAGGCSERPRVNAFPNPTSVPSASFPEPLRQMARVSFGEGSAELSERAKSIIADNRRYMAEVYRSDATPVAIVGHSNAAEARRHGRALSRRRAEAVAAEWLRLGYPRASLTVEGVGDSVPAHPFYAADGTGEIARRAVEMRFGQQS